jgi:hypothetical protein
VIKCLKIEPEQEEVVNHIRLLLTSTLVTCDQMLAVYLAYIGVNNPHLKRYELSLREALALIVPSGLRSCSATKLNRRCSSTAPN